MENFFCTNLPNQYQYQFQFHKAYEHLIEGKEVNLEDIGTGGVIQILRKYFEEKEPILFTAAQRDLLIDIERVNNEKEEKLRVFIDGLPPHIACVLDFILYFAGEIIHHNRESVHPESVARFLVGLIFRNPPNQLIESQLLINSMIYFILHYDCIFKNITYVHKRIRGEAETTDTKDFLDRLKDKVCLHNHIKATSRGIKILCLDGGGIRGLVLVTILSKIAEILFGNSDEEGTHKLLNCFDLICGTSTGGILSVALASGFSLKRARKTYYMVSTQVFPVRYMTLPYRWTRYFWSGDYYDSYLLKSVYKEEFGDRDFKLIDKHLFLTTTDASTNIWKPALIRTYENPKSPYFSVPDVSIPEALRITSAAPTYFSPVKLKDRTYIDGGMTANNPTELAIFETHDKWPEHYVDLILSLGTGTPEEIKSGVGLYGLANGVINIVTSSEEIHHRVEDWIRLTNPEPPYFRFSPPGLGSIPLDTSSAVILEQMEKKTEEFMETQRDLIKNELSKYLL